MAGLFAGTPLERPVTCETCEKPLDQCRCPRDASGRVLRPRDQQVRVQRERRSGGGWVTVVHGLDGAANDLNALLKELKSACAAGGGVSEGNVVIQGDHRDRVVSLLRAKGYQAKAAGG
jgi:translation initiation factor 1